jgi:glycopeptide antibiotics resistance protein
MLHGQVFSLVAVVGLAIWLAIDLTRHPERRIESVVNALFVLYVIAVIQVTMFPIPLHASPPRPAPATRLNLVPLVAMFGTEISRVQALPNIVMGIPFGVLGFVVLRHASWVRILALGAGFFLVVELLQVVEAHVFPAAPRTGDVNDLILNTIGVAIGVGLFPIAARTLRDRDDDLGTSPVASYLRTVIARRDNIV